MSDLISVLSHYDDNGTRATKPQINSKTVAKYIQTRIPTLLALPNTSFKSTLNYSESLRPLTKRHWNYFMCGFMCWVIDSMDFFCVSACASSIAVTLGRSLTDITWGITLVLMLRSVGALIFGYLGDNYGRKYPLIACLVLFVALEIGTGFVQTYEQFLGVRALFGIAMGGCYGLAAATALDDAPSESRSFLSGIFLPGYNLGYIFAIIFWRAFEFTPHSWRALFWFSSAPPVLLIIWRLSFPELESFLELKEKKRLHNLSIEEDVAAGLQPRKKVSNFSQLIDAFRTQWLTFLYLIFLMSGFNFMSHGSQDLFPTMLSKQLLFSADQSTVTMVVLNLGAITGGLFIGQLTELTGRRLGIVICCIMGGAFIYPVFIKHQSQAMIMGCGFFMQFAIMGCWGIAPIHLFELCSGTQYRAMFSGLAYQLGNLASSASSTIEAKIGSRFPLEGGLATYDYGRVMAIFMGCVFGYLMLISIVGFERFHQELQTKLHDEPSDAYNDGKLDRYDDDDDAEVYEGSITHHSKRSVQHLENA